MTITRRVAWVGPIDAALATGGLAWVAGLLLLPAPMAARILLLAPLVIVPRLLAALPPRGWMGAAAGWPALIAALPLLGAFALQPGPAAVALAVPWLALAGLGAAAAVIDGAERLPAIRRPSSLPALGIDAGLGFWAVGAAFIVLDRAAISAGFSPAIVLLTAVHFHYAGFGLLAVASLRARVHPWLRLAIAGLIVGIPLTAAGFVIGVTAINALGALLVGLAGVGVAVSLLRDPERRGLDRVAGIALLVGAPMGVAWSIAILTGIPFLGLDQMIRTHGALNSTAVLLAVLALRSAAGSEPVSPG